MEIVKAVLAIPIEVPDHIELKLEFIGDDMILEIRVKHKYMGEGLIKNFYVVNGLDSVQEVMKIQHIVRRMVEKLN
ncbi:hypothetical protein [Niallia taxi]|uniref:hypothetical protein n=1 Tax=Niallia taxi TaxID=2499688 RepID=UPI00300BAD76